MEVWSCEGDEIRRLNRLNNLLLSKQLFCYITALSSEQNEHVEERPCIDPEERKHLQEHMVQKWYASPYCTHRCYYNDIIVINWTLTLISSIRELLQSSSVCITGAGRKQTSRCP